MSKLRHHIYDNHFIHPHHEVLCDYTHRLNEEYDTLPRRWIDYFLVRCSKLMSEALHKRNSYLLDYNPDTMVFTQTGFPTYDLKRKFTFIPMQLEYCLHKMDYQQVKCYRFGKTWIKLEWYKTKPADEDCVIFVNMTEEDYNNEEERIDCNILTIGHRKCHCSCHCCHKCKEDDEETDDTSNEGGDNDGNGNTDGNNNNADGNNDGGDDNTTTTPEPSPDTPLIP